MQQAKRYRLRRDGITWSDLGDEVVILDLRSSTYFSARGTAAVLVNVLVSGASADTLVTRVITDYDTTERTARDDVTTFIQQLENRGLLEQFNG